MGFVQSLLGRSMLPVALLVCFAQACTSSTPRYEDPDPWLLHTAEVPPPPDDPADPIARVIWTLNYDMREFDRTLAWLTDDVPAGPERTRALALTHMLGMAELGRREMIRPGVALFEQAIADRPDDKRFLLWHAYVKYMGAWVDGDDVELDESLDLLDACLPALPRFNLAGPELTVAGNPASSPETLRKARDALYGIMAATLDLQYADDEEGRYGLRRSWNSPIAPYLIPATFAMKGDISLLIGDVATARREYYKAAYESASYRWPWHAEVERRFREIDQVRTGFEAQPPTEYAFGSTFPWAMGTGDGYRIETFGGRVGNGSSSFCHSHVSLFDLPTPPELDVGWIRGRFAVEDEIPDPAPYFFAMPSTSKDAKPAGIAVGLAVPAEAPRDFYDRDEYFNNEFLITAAPGSYFVAGVLSTGEDGDGLLGTKKYKGYSRRLFGLPRYYTVEAGKVADIRDQPILLSATQND